MYMYKNGSIEWLIQILVWSVFFEVMFKVGLSFSIFLAILAVALIIITFVDLYKGKRDFERVCVELNNSIEELERRGRWLATAHDELRATTMPRDEAARMEVRTGIHGAVRAEITHNPFVTRTSNRAQRREQIQVAMEGDARKKFAYPETSKKKKKLRTRQSRAELLPDVDVLEPFDED